MLFRSTARGSYPFGGRPSNDDGAAAVAQAILEEPYGTVLYDHHYSWHWRYHFFYRGTHVEWFEDEEDLIENLSVFFQLKSEDNRYLALKIGDELSESLKITLPSAGYGLNLVAAEGKIELYQIILRPQ